MGIEKTLINKAKQLCRKNDIAFDQKRFKEAIEQYHTQHSCYPDKLSVVDAQGLQQDYLIPIGKTTEIRYVPPKNSRKNTGDVIYTHHSKDTLVTNPDGNLLAYLGNTKVAKNGINKGWLIK